MARGGEGDRCECIHTAQIPVSRNMHSNKVNLQQNKQNQIDSKVSIPFSRISGLLRVSKTVRSFIKLNLMNWSCTNSRCGRLGYFHIRYYVTETEIGKSQVYYKV